MVRNLRKTCNVCFKEMRGDKLKKHMKKHERGNEYNFITKGLHDGKTEDNVVTMGLHDGKTEDNVANNEEQISCKDEELEKRVFDMEEFNRMIELG